MTKRLHLHKDHSWSYARAYEEAARESNLNRSRAITILYSAHTIVVFYYDIFPEVHDRLDEHGIALHYLATWRDVLAEARDGRYFETSTMDEVEAFLDRPLEWSAAHGGKGEISI